MLSSISPESARKIPGVWYALAGVGGDSGVPGTWYSGSLLLGGADISAGLSRSREGGCAPSNRYVSSAPFFPSMLMGEGMGIKLDSTSFRCLCMALSSTVSPSASLSPPFSLWLYKTLLSPGGGNEGKVAGSSEGIRLFCF